MNPPFRVGLIGCGDIARKAYLPFARQQQDFVITACCDARLDFAESLAREFAIPRAISDPGEIIEAPDIDIVLNLTHPAAHAPLNLRAVRAGKHVYVEKPFGLDRAEARAVLDAADKNGCLVGCAPDTVLGPGTQHVRRLLANGVIGQPLFARLVCASGGHESWHPNPAFYYAGGGGPMLDMGPYHLSFLIHCLGPVKNVGGRAVRGFRTRTITSSPLAGTIIPVETPTHYVGSMEMVCGVIVDVCFSFDLPFGYNGSNLPEIYGTEGRLQAPDPNKFEGSVHVNSTRRRDTPLQIVPDNTPTGPTGRGLGLVDLCRALREKRPPRASGELAYHVLDVMLAFHDSEKEERRIEIGSTCNQPLLLPAGGLV
ncbi:MAG: Gfo/Idh/MocA family oxidoreductase [Opitutales bacterium]|nr:Gfo/Idh/MocA family oxidoreductase [Opitutales bacterium]